MLQFVIESITVVIKQNDASVFRVYVDDKKISICTNTYSNSYNFSSSIAVTLVAWRGTKELFKHDTKLFKHQFESETR